MTARDAHERSSHTARILVVDDEPAVATAIARQAERFGYGVATAEGVTSARRMLEEGGFDIVLTDLHLGDGDGFEVLRHVQERAPDVPVVVITGQATVDSAMQAIQEGAHDYIAKPPQMESLRILLNGAIEKRRMAAAVHHLQSEIKHKFPIDQIAGRSPQMLEVFKTVARVAPSRANVLILGESGTGKEMVARAIHAKSDRQAGRFVPLNVPAIPEGLLESELFGHIRGAFTGANATRRGLFEEANGGTLFLDEIGDLPPALQAKLLRVIQEQRLRPVGSNEEIAVDVRLVAATHRNLEAMVGDGTFREDLYYRLNVVSIALPPLRERAGDIPELIEHFRAKYRHATGRPPAEFSPGAIRLLLDYPWPGNVRELENVVERVLVLSSRNIVTEDDLPPRVRLEPRRFIAGLGEFVTLEEMNNRYIREVIDHVGGNITRAARILGISRRTLHRMDERRRRVGDDDETAGPDAGQSDASS